MDAYIHIYVTIMYACMYVCVFVCMSGHCMYVSCLYVYIYAAYTHTHILHTHFTHTYIQACIQTCICRDLAVIFRALSAQKIRIHAYALNNKPMDKDARDVKWYTHIRQYVAELRHLGELSEYLCVCVYLCIYVYICVCVCAYVCRRKTPEMVHTYKATCD